jgi:hypothetical protein
MNYFLLKTKRPRLKVFQRSMRRCRPAFAVALVLQIGAFGQRCEAWNQSGHNVVGLLVHSQLSDTQRTRFVALLRQHPCFERHFLGAMPNEVWQGTDADKDLWIFAHAGQWPDLVRGQSNIVTREESERYNKPSWHFLDLPFYLAPEDEKELAGIIRLNTSTSIPAATEEPTCNAVQAIKLLLQKYKQTDATDADRAICLCWLLHLVADIHQPCHSTALFSRKLLPEGDGGAGKLLTDRRETLHGVWDRALVDREDYVLAQAKARRLAARLKESDTTERDRSGPEEWLHESHELAKQFVYSSDVRTAALAWEQSGKIDELSLSPDYLAQMRKVAEQQALVAARRLVVMVDSL